MRSKPTRNNCAIQPIVIYMDIYVYIYVIVYIYYSSTIKYTVTYYHRYILIYYFNINCIKPDKYHMILHTCRIFKKENNLKGTEYT